MEHTFDDFYAFIAQGRNKHDRPLANNTRAILRDEDTIAIQLHSTDVVTYHRDGRIALNSGGWRTNTTQDRIRAYSPARVSSESGVWSLRVEPDPNDPEPPYGHRTIPKPFHALDPGPEPVKGDEGCIAGTSTTETREGREFVDGAFVEIEREVTTHYVEDRGYHERTRDTEYEQCPHCSLFDRQHDAWDLAMNGERWGKDRGKGYRQMTEMLERFGSREDWQVAYLDDFRAAKQANAEHRAWVARNYTLFEDGVVVNADGYAPRKSERKAKREASKLRAINAKKREINEFVKFCCDELAAGHVPMPSGGDCWLCCMRDSDTGEPWGDWRGDDHEHLQSHIDEKYVVPSMLVNAMRERGYKDTGVYILLGMDHENNVMGRGYRREQSAHGGDAVQRALRAYLTSRLVPDASGSAPSGAAYRETGLQTGGR